MVPRVRYSLSFKSLSDAAPPPGTAQASNPAMLNRPGAVQMDEGREWAGDKYDEGPVSDPTQAYARFTGPDDTEAWLDKNDDGTLIGWVRQGSDVWRYSDPDAWAMDVDGNGMQEAAGDQASSDTSGDNADQAPADQAADQQEPDADQNGGPSDADADNPPDPNAQPADQQTDQPDEFDNPFADLQAETEQAAAASDTSLPDGNQDTPADDSEDPNAEDEKKKKKKRTLFGGKVQVKHYPKVLATKELDSLGRKWDPAKHPRDSRGRFIETGGIVRDAAGDVGKVVRSLLGGKVEVQEPDGSTRTVRGNQLTMVKRPDGSKPTSDPKKVAAMEPPTADKASLTPEAIKALSDEDLAAITESGQLYDMETMLAAAGELDRRNDVDAMTRGFAKHTEPGSPERQALFDSVIPDRWATWAAQGAKGNKPSAPTKRQQIERAYQDHVAMQYQEALAVTNGNFFNNQASRMGDRPVDEMAFFDGRADRRQVRKYASEELLRYFADHPRMTFSEFAAEFYPSYAKAKSKVGSRYLSEHG